MTRSIISTATTAMAIVALAAPTALARPADMPPSTAAAQAKQELRSPDVIDAATQQNKQDLRAPDTSEDPTRPAQGEQANPRPVTPPQAPADPSVAWEMIGLGIAGLVAAAAIAGIASRTRRNGRARIAA